jgi:hypothetical protein
MGIGRAMTGFTSYIDFFMFNRQIVEDKVYVTDVTTAIINLF